MTRRLTQQLLQFNYSEKPNTAIRKVKIDKTPLPEGLSELDLADGRMIGFELILSVQYIMTTAIIATNVAIRMKRKTFAAKSSSSSPSLVTPLGRVLKREI